MKAAVLVFLAATICVTVKGDAKAQLRGNERNLRVAYYGMDEVAPDGCFAAGEAHTDAAFQPKWAHPQGLLSQSSCDQLCQEKGYRFSATTNFDWAQALERPKMCLCANLGRKVVDPVADTLCHYDTNSQYYYVKEVNPEPRSTAYSGVPVKAFEGCWGEDNMARTTLEGNTITLPSPDGTTSDDDDCQVQCYNYGFKYSWYQPGPGENGANYCSCVELPPELPLYYSQQTYPCAHGGKVFQVWEEATPEPRTTSTVSAPPPTAAPAPQVTWYNRNTSPATTATWQTWSLEEAFCSAQGQQLCSYDDLCPGGIGTEPVGFAANHDRWAAVTGSTVCPNNGWVQIGKRDGVTTHYCKPHENFGSAGCPSWGVHQNGGTAYWHENIACCSVP